MTGGYQGAQRFAQSEPVLCRAEENPRHNARDFGYKSDLSRPCGFFAPAVLVDTGLVIAFEHARALDLCIISS
jgi:hypothetical protein